MHSSKFKRYILKHKDINCLVFDIDSNSNIINVILQNQPHLPLSFKINSDFDIKANLYNWISKRIIPASRMKYDRLLECLKLDDFHKINFILENKGLSLSDCYWIADENSDNTWDNTNYYNNSFNQDLIDIYIDSTITPDIKNKVIINPSNTLDGYLPKAWIIKDNKRLLYKRSSIEDREIINEVICSEIYSRLNIDHIKYDYSNYNNKDCCSCECMCDDNTDYITANQFVNHFKNDNESSIECLCNKLKEIYNNDNKFYEMIQMDFVLANIDRHWNNFGFLRNADSLEYIKFAPIYDNGNSLWFNKQINKIGTNDVYRMFINFNLFDLKNKLLKNKLFISKDLIRESLAVINDKNFSHYDNARNNKIYNECNRWLDLLYEKSIVVPINEIK